MAVRQQDYQPGGTIYAVPYGAGYYYTVYYNKTLFARAGITGPMPTTWEAMVSLAKKIKAKGITPFEFGEKEGYFGAWTMDSLISGLGGNNGVLAMYNGKKSLNTSLLIKPYTAWHQLFADGLTNSDAATLTYTTGVANFAAGKAAMTITGQYYDDQISKGLGKNVGLFPVPTAAGSKNPKLLSGGPNNSYVIFKNSKHVSADIKLIEFLTTPQVQEPLGPGTRPAAQQRRRSSPTASLRQGPAAAGGPETYINADHYILFEAFDNIMPGSIDSYWYQTNNGVFAGSLSPASAASSMQSQMDHGDTPRRPPRRGEPGVAGPGEVRLPWTSPTASSERPPRSTPRPYREKTRRQRRVFPYVAHGAGGDRGPRAHGAADRRPPSGTASPTGTGSPPRSSG